MQIIIESSEMDFSYFPPNATYILCKIFNPSNTTNTNIFFHLAETYM